MNRRKIGLVILWSCLLIWLGMIYVLSSQNGLQTEQTSLGMARKIAEYIYKVPTISQVTYVHMCIRKMAHVVLFFILGLLCYMSVACTLQYSGVCLKFLVAAGLTSLFGFFDEWHKQFIIGRHFDYGETILNIGSGVLGTIAGGVVFFIVVLRALDKSS